MKRIKLFVIIVFVLFIIVSAFRLFLGRLEGRNPSLQMNPPITLVSASQELSISITDKKSGVRKVWVGLLKDGKETVLLEKSYPYAGLFGGGSVHEDEIKLLIKPKELGISDGSALLRMAGWDYSWRRWGHGNRTYVEKKIIIDTTPPEVEILTSTHNITQGGAGLVIYRISEPCSKSGVYVGGNFFPGHSGYFKDKNILMAFIALNYNQGSDTELFAKVLDRAGNSSRAGFPHYIRKRIFKKDTITLSDRFLNWKMPEFEIDVPRDSNIPLAEKFLIVNRKIRETSFDTIKRIGEKADNILYWNDAFLRLPRSSRQAGYADHRDYLYKGRKIDSQVHLGIDLASVSHSPVPAANKGRVAFTGHIGIYGKTVIIDHGFGLFTTYSHLSGISVKQGQIVSKGDIIGRTGNTGLAGGDHLHNGFMIHNTFVNPVEWWDPNWIRNNISNKIEAVASIQS